MKKSVSVNQPKVLKELKPAYKGGATIIQNHLEYVAEGFRQLSNRNYYRQLDNDPTDDHNCKFASHLENMRLWGEITEKSALYLVTE